MPIDILLPSAQARLVTLADDAPLVRAAELLRTGTDILAVCNAGGVLQGVITKTDVVTQISQCQGANCTKLASTVMMRDVELCRSGDSLTDLWARMQKRGLKNVPYVDQSRKPLGIINARDLLQELLKESIDEEALMRDYVMGVGYR